MLFDCILIANTRIKGGQVENAMPLAMINSIESMTAHDKVLFLYRCLNGPPMQEWLLIYRVVAEFVVVLGKNSIKR